MCLATAYKNNLEDNKIICENITKIVVEGENVTLVDIIGMETVVTGRISMVDLTKSIVVVDC